MIMPPKSNDISTHAQRLSKTELDRLVRAVAPVMVFQRGLHLVITIPSEPNLPLKQYQEKIRKCRLSKKYTWAVQLHCEIERQYRLGHLFYSTFCIQENVVYAQEGFAVKMIWEKLATIKMKASAEFIEGMKKARQFYKGACFYWAGDDFNMAAFMLHQATELCLRAVILSMIAEEVRTHTLNELLCHCKRVAPEVSRWFDGFSRMHPELFLLLDQAYSQVRYTNSFAITGADVQLLILKIKDLHSVADSLVQEVLNQYCQTQTGTI